MYICIQKGLTEDSVQSDRFVQIRQQFTSGNNLYLAVFSSDFILYLLLM